MGQQADSNGEKRLLKTQGRIDMTYMRRENESIDDYQVRVNRYVLWIEVVGLGFIVIGIVVTTLLT